MKSTSIRRNRLDSLFSGSGSIEGQHAVFRTPVFVVFALSVATSCRDMHARPAAAAAALDVPEWLAARGRQEAELAARSPVAHDFQFTDRRRESGITFVDRVVDDAGRNYNMAHYDHGNGVCAADVDGDGLPDLFFVTSKSMVSAA